MDRGNIDNVSSIQRYQQVDQWTKGDNPSNRAPDQGEFCKNLEENVLKFLNNGPRACKMNSGPYTLIPKLEKQTHTGMKT